MSDTKKITLAMTGASGAIYGLRLLEVMIESGQQVYLVVSKPAQIVIGMETDLKLPSRVNDIQKFLSEKYQAKKNQLTVFDREQWTAPIASGTSAADAMVVCPCTTGSLAAIANGYSDNLIHRAADVMLKERRALLLMVRETPYSQIHLENMLKVTQAGGVIMPSNPGFYNNPKSINDLVDFMVSRILDHLDIPNTLTPRWGLDYE